MWGKWSRILQRPQRCIDPDMELAVRNIDQHGMAEDHGIGTLECVSDNIPLNHEDVSRMIGQSIAGRCDEFRRLGII